MNNTNFAKAFIEAQKEMGNAQQNSKNPFFKSKYADLNSIREACLPVLNKHAIAVLQPTIQIDGKNFVKTILLHESGESMESLTEIVFSKHNDAQAQGSGITYARRYGLQSMVNIGAEDDDGNEASKQQTIKKEEYIEQDQALKIQELCKKTNTEISKICEVYKINSIIDLPADKYQKVIQQLNKKLTNNVDS